MDEVDTPGSASRSRARLLAKLAAQTLGFLIGIAMLGYCVQLALSGENRRALQSLSEASPAALLALVGLSAISVMANGLIFWATLAPVRRLAAIDVVATNFLSTFLANLPFKIGLLVRIAIHTRRDRVPLATVMAWMAAVSATLVMASGALLVAALVRDATGPLTAPLAVVLMAAGCAAMVFVARRLSGEAGHRRLSRLIARFGGRRAMRMARGDVARQLHAGIDMLADGRWIAVVMLARVLDFAAQSLRMIVAGDLVDVAVRPTNGMIIAGGHYVVGAVSPFGMLGFREGGAVGIAVLLGYDKDGFAPVSLLASGSEIIATITGAGLAIAWLRLDRILRGKTAGKRRAPAA
ncbi:MAG: lysylphosphatidylglycerol synthase domain-containing protein [Planctomycetota bacterium]